MSPTVYVFVFSTSGILLYHVLDLFHATYVTKVGRVREKEKPSYPPPRSPRLTRGRTIMPMSSEQYRITRASHIQLLAGTSSLGNNLDRLITLPWEGAPRGPRAQRHSPTPLASPPPFLFLPLSVSYSRWACGPQPNTLARESLWGRERSAWRRWRRRHAVGAWGVQDRLLWRRCKCVFTWLFWLAE